MARPALGVLLFLFLAGRGVSTDPEGELCPAVPGAAGGAFRCPQLLDGADAKFCCGTCSLPYCCTAREAELEGQRCPRSALLETQAAQGPPTTHRPPTTHSPSTATQSLPTTTRPPTDRPLERWSGLLAFAALLIVVILWNIFVYCARRWHRQRVVRHGSLFNVQLPLWEFIRGRRYFYPPSPSRTPPSDAADALTSSAEGSLSSGDMIQPPPSPVVIFHRAFSGSSEDDVTLGPLVHRNVPNSSSETPPLEEELPAAD